MNPNDYKDIDSKYNSFSEDESRYIYDQDPIDHFISHETDYILDLYYDIRDRVPYFLDRIRFPDLFNFILDNKFNMYKNEKYYDERKLDKFYTEYKSEINGILYVINGYLSKYKKFQIDSDIFWLFAYDFTTKIY